MNEEVLAAARSLAQDLAVEGGDPDAPRWTGFDVVGEEGDPRIVEGPIGAGLYDGSAGIALALAAASSAGVTGAVPRVARAAAADALRSDRALAPTASQDLASGTPGIAYAVAWAGALLGCPELVDGARALARTTARRLRTAGLGPDLLVGRSGAVLALLAVAGDDSEVLAAAVDVMRDVAAEGRAEPWGRSWGWSDDGPGLLGLAHGASGIAVAMGEVAARTPQDAELGEAVYDALAYERSWFDPDRPGWPDLRSHAAAGADVASDPGCPTAWCHGALGIGIARLRLAELQEPAERLPLLAEAGAAVHAARQLVVTVRGSLRSGAPADCSLCHGLGGVVDLLLAADRVTGAADHLRAARRVALLMLEQRRAAGCWPCGLSHLASVRSGRGEPAPEPPGLFLGRAGVLLTLLRAADPDVAPSCTLPEVLPRSAAVDHRSGPGAQVPTTSPNPWAIDSRWA